MGRPVKAATSDRGEDAPAPVRLADFDPLMIDDTLVFVRFLPGARHRCLLMIDRGAGFGQSRHGPRVNA